MVEMGMGQNDGVDAGGSTETEPNSSGATP